MAKREPIIDCDRKNELIVYNEMISILLSLTASVVKAQEVKGEPTSPLARLLTVFSERLVEDWKKVVGPRTPDEDRWLVWWTTDEE